MPSSYAPLQGAVVCLVARICGNLLQVVAAELPENLSCVAMGVVCSGIGYTGLNVVVA